MYNSRTMTTEFLDQPDCDPALAVASYRFMEMINCHFGGVRVVKNFLAAEAVGRHPDVPLRILDIGSGSCDIPLAVSKWAQTYGIPLRFTCLEMADQAIDIARRQLAEAGDSTVQLFQEDAFTHQPAEPYDYAVSSMCFHHLNDERIVTLLRRLRGFVNHSVLINDLRRSPLASWAARLLLSGTGAPAGVRHDALLSIKRGFKINELSALLRQLDNVTFSVEPTRWFRIAAIIHFKSGDNL